VHQFTCDWLDVNSYGMLAAALNRQRACCHLALFYVLSTSKIANKVVVLPFS
jgi:hypothetical protein